MDTPGVRGALAGEKRSLRSCGAATAGEDSGESSHGTARVAVAGVGLAAAGRGWRRWVCGVAWMR